MKIKVTIYDGYQQVETGKILPIQKAILVEKNKVIDIY